MASRHQMYRPFQTEGPATEHTVVLPNEDVITRNQAFNRRRRREKVNRLTPVMSEKGQQRTHIGGPECSNTAIYHLFNKYEF